MVYKKFSKKLFNQNDPKARKLCKELFSKKFGVELVDNPDKYGPDLMHKDGKKFVECEIKKVWSGDVFPYATVQFPERKWKYTRAGPVTFVMFNAECTSGLFVDGQDVIKSPLKPVKNIYVSRGENFFQVPMSKVDFFSLQDE